MFILVSKLKNMASVLVWTKTRSCWLNLPFPKVSLLVKERHDFLEVIQPHGGLDTKEPVHQTV